MIEKFFLKAQNIVDAVFSKTVADQWPVVRLLWLAGLYFLGIFLWGKFFDWGKTPLDFFDWAMITMPRLDFIQDALKAGVFPLHMADTASLHNISDRFFTLPDVITTPQMLLLVFMPIQQFVFLDILLHYTLGFLGIFWFYKRYELSLYTFTILFLLFGFNGYILAHYSVGHVTWAGYFLFPVFFSLIIRFLEGEQGWRWVSSVAGLLFYMLLAGSYHHFIWLSIFLIVLAIVQWRRSGWVLAAIISAGLLGAVRLLPPALQLSDYNQKLIFNAVYGYPSLMHLFQAMSFIQLPVESPIKYFSMNLYAENYWDYNFYVGIIGTIFLLYFGVYAWLRESTPKFRQLILPVFILLALSIDSTYWIFRMTNIPLFEAERATMRIAGVPLVWLMLVGAISFQAWWNKRQMGTNQKIIAFIGLGFLSIDLWSNLKNWNPAAIKSYFEPFPMHLDGNSVANHADPLYTNILILSLGMTLLTAIVLFILSWREHKKRANVIVT